MTKEELGEYLSLKREIGRLEKRLDKLEHKEVPEVAGKVQASEDEFPWLQRRVSVQMNSPKINDVRKKNIEVLEKRKEKCEKEMLKVEQFIDRIQDSELRQIFEMRYIDGMKQSDMAAELHLDRSRISRKITEYLQNAHKAQNDVL